LEALGVELEGNTLCIKCIKYNVLKWFFRKWDRGAWTGLMAQDRDRWWALVDAVMNLAVP